MLIIFQTAWLLTFCLLAGVAAGNSQQRIPGGPPGVPVIRASTDGSGHFHHRGFTVSGLTAQMKASAARSGQAQQWGGERTADGKDQPRVACTECGDLLLPFRQRTGLCKAASQVVAALKNDIVATWTDNLIWQHVHAVVPAGFLHAGDPASGE